MRFKSFLSLFAIASVVMLSSQAHAQKWGTIKGKVVWAGKAIPARKVINAVNCPVPKNKLPLHDEKLVINPKNRGVKWAVVFLARIGPGGGPALKLKLPIHPGLKNLKKKTVTIDQPCCLYEPRVITMREGQSLIAKNSSTTPHNVNLQGNSIHSPQENKLIPAGGKHHFQAPWKARYRATPVGCNIHGWMSGWIWVFPDPYHAVTDENGEFEIKDAPAGKYNLVVWHEEIGWVNGRNGQTITINGGKVNKVKDIKMK